MCDDRIYVYLHRIVQIVMQLGIYFFASKDELRIV